MSAKHGEYIDYDKKDMINLMSYLTGALAWFDHAVV